MLEFKKTTHLSEILEESHKNTVTIFIHSNSCNISTRIKKIIEKEADRTNSKPNIYMITVQTEPVLSKKIEDWFQIKHESPQIINISKGKVLYTDHHNNIKIDKFIN